MTAFPKLGSFIPPPVRAARAGMRLYHTRYPESFTGSLRPAKAVTRRRTMSYRNLADLHRRQAERLGPRTALRFKQHGLYHDLSWERYRADALACAAALVEAGMRPGDRVGLLAEN